MEFPFDLSNCLVASVDQTGFCVVIVDEHALRSSAGLCRVLEELGQRSAYAQGLGRPVTSGYGLGEHRVYLLANGRKVFGFLKIGRKRLFVAAPSAGARAFADVQDTFCEIEPLCALDFYVHENCQRSGHGRRIFDAMLAREGAFPAGIAYDRPSDKLLAFLQNHYGLVRFSPQNNNFVVFDSYFEDTDARAEDHRNRLDRLGRQHSALQLGGSRPSNVEERRRCREEPTPARKSHEYSGALRAPYDTLPQTRPSTASQRAAVLVAQQEIHGVGAARRSGCEALRGVPGGDLFNRGGPPSVTRRATGA